MSKIFRLEDVRLSYEHIFRATSFDDSQPAKFSATLIVPKNHKQVTALKRTMLEVGKEAFPADFTGNAWPRGYTCSLKDADIETDGSGTVLAEKNPEYKNCYILEVNSTRRPNVVNRNRSAIVEEDGIIYSGCYVNVNIGIAPYTFGKVKKGIKGYLNGVQFVKDGERLSGNSGGDFDDLDGDADDFMG